MPMQPVFSKQHSNRELLNRLQTAYPTLCNTLLLINIQQQHLYYLQDLRLISEHTISSASLGIGQQSGSNQTPLGAHLILEKFGDNAPLGAIFRGRQDTGEVATILTDKDARSDQDNITSRILRLGGLEAGINQGGNVDSYRRYIYLHGTDEEGLLGTPASHGCIRLANQDIIDLYPRLPINTLVYIYEN